jgi:FkbM family methyltransferase
MKKFNELMEKIGDTEDFFFVQIGSNDGVRNDPLYKFICKYNWSGIMVEPVPHLYERLIKNHEGRDNLTFRNVAISSEGGSMKFYSATENCIHNGISSLSKQHILSHTGPKHQDLDDIRCNFNKHFKEDELETITFGSLVDGVNHIDLLHIDAEGHDFEIIKSIDFDKIIPSVILYEHAKLYSGPRRRRRTCEANKKVMQFLNECGYECYPGKFDTLAIHKTSS